MEKNFEFEPFQQVLVWDSDYRLWRADFFSHNEWDSEYPFCCVRDDWRQCIPYTPETAHILGTAQPYEPPKPPVEYEWGQKVQVLRNGQLIAGLYVGKAQDGEHHILLSTQILASVHVEAMIRPLPDSA